MNHLVLYTVLCVFVALPDDAHIFCTKEQIGKEVADFIKLTLDVYKDFGFEEVQMKLSTRPEKRVGDDALWDLAEKSLADA